MSHVQQTCPLCNWSRFVRVPQTADREFDDVIARHVGRSLQWEWQAHVMREHSSEMVNAYDVLTLAGFDTWVEQEGQERTVEETPPSEGEGYTVGVNHPIITPDQARNLADAVERTMVSAAEGIQHFAEQMVPALHAAQAQLVNGLRELVEQRPGRTNACRCNGGHDAHEPGADGCLFKPYVQSDDLLASQQRWAKRFGAVAQVGLRQDAKDWRRRWDETSPAADVAPFGRVTSEVCSCCLRVQGEPHQFPNCDMAAES